MLRLCRVFVLILVGIFMFGCRSLGPEANTLEDVLGSVDSTGKPLPRNNGKNLRSIFGRQGAENFSGIVSQGTGQFVSNRAPTVVAGKTSAGEEGYRLNLIEAPIEAAAKNILGDILNLNYTVDSRVKGKMTLQTSSPVSRASLIDIFESALITNGAAIVKAGGSFRIVPIGEALASTPAISVPSVSPSGPGIVVQVIELRFISADEMRNILSPISREGAILRSDVDRNYLMIAGTGADLASMREAISVFDVDWMRGMSVALHPLKTSQPSQVARELETIFGAKDGPGAKVIRFVANERLKSVLVITSRPQYLKRAEKWIRQLDRLADTNEERLFVYEIQNRPAEELAKVLQSILTASNAASADSSVAPDLQAVDVSSGGDASAIGTINGQANAKGTSTSVVADTENNALLISTTAREFERIERILQQLDILPTQVFLEAVIAEVSLNDELKFGVRWFFDHGGFNLKLTDLASGATAPSFPGLGWTFLSNDIQLTLNALSSVTDVKVISSPNLMAMNNQKAILQIGDQVPIVTQTSTGTGAPGAPVISNIVLKDTGIILSMTPRVNTSGRIIIDIEQEVSSVVKTTTSGIDSPTIQQRKIATRVVVNDGEALALGGLIQERTTGSRGQVPILGDIPIIGNLFRNKTDLTTRTELIIFIRPRVVRDTKEARAVTDEFRRRLDFSEKTFEQKANKELRRLR